MGVLLGLGGVQLLQAIGGDNVGGTFSGTSLGKATSTSNVGSYSVIVTKCELDLLALKAVELLVREHAGHLTARVGTEVEENSRVALSWMPSLWAAKGLTNSSPRGSPSRSRP